MSRSRSLGSEVAALRREVRDLRAELRAEPDPSSYPPPILLPPPPARKPSWGTILLGAVVIGGALYFGGRALAAFDG